MSKPRPERTEDPMGDGLPLEEMDFLYRSLSAEERDELLQSLLVAASISGDTVIRRLEEYMLVLAQRDLLDSIDDHAQGGGRSI